MNNKENLVYIPITELHPHPDNPRKDVGDVTELAESIKSKGVMQNLTVVRGRHYVENNEPCYNPNEGFTVIIGHRRMAASKLAGLTELPCVVVNMDYKDQVATMLLENMQRSDLTILEEAAGIQMMLDLGETVEGIAQKTGFSQNTVRRRTKLYELNQDKLKTAMTRQVTLSDLDKLNKIENIETRNKLLDDIGTSNYAYKLQRAIDAEERAKNENKWRKHLMDIGMTEIDYGHCWDYGIYEHNYVMSVDNPEDFIKGEDEKFFAMNYGSIYIRGPKKAATDEEKERKKKREQEQRIKDKLDEISNRMYKLRRAFVFNIPETVAMKNIGLIAEMVMRQRYEECGQGGWYMRWQGQNFTDGEIPQNYSDISEMVEKHPYQTMLRNAYALWADGSSVNTYNYGLEYTGNERLSLIYEFICRLGYEMSDEEKQIMDGTHKLYAKQGGESDDR